MTSVTMLIAIPIGTFGYINLSDMLIYLLATAFPLEALILISGIGTALADILLGYTQYALITFFAKSLEAFVVYCIFHKVKLKNYIAFPCGAITMLAVYAIGDCILGGNLALFFNSLALNLPQGIICVGLALIAYKPFTYIMERLYNGSKQNS